MNGTPGTEFPAGTGEQPVDNLADAITIATLEGFTRLYIRGDFTLGATGVVDDYEIIGQSHERTTVTVTSGCSTSGTEFIDCKLTGVLNGKVHAHSCVLYSITGFDGMMMDCILEGDVALAGSNTVHILDSWSGVPGAGVPVIDMGGDGPGLGVRAYSGGIKLTNKAGVDNVSLDFISGHAVIDSTVTDGDIVVRGVAKLTDNSTGSTVVDATNLVNPYTMSDQTWDEARADHINAGSMGEAEGEIVEVLDQLENKLVINEDTSELWLYNDVGDTVIKKWPITDKDSASVSLTSGPPANRDARTL